MLTTQQAMDQAVAAARALNALREVEVEWHGFAQPLARKALAAVEDLHEEACRQHDAADEQDRARAAKEVR